MSPKRFSSYDLVMVPADWVGLHRLRRQVLEGASGRVLEVGSGTGLNLRHYAGPERLVAVDIGHDKTRRLLERSRIHTHPLAAVVADGVYLPFREGSFDTVVITLSLCTIPDPAGALREVRRVLVPGGSFRFLEHVHDRRRWVARLQSFATPAWRRFTDGCHLDRDTVGAIRRAGFEITSLDYGAAGWMAHGVARRP